MNFNLNIAGYVINLESFDFNLVPGKRFENFICPSPALSDSDLRIRVFPGSSDIPSGTICVFHAPFIEEIDGKKLEKDPEFWSIWKNGTDLFIKSTFPLSAGNKKALLKFSLETKIWDLWIDSKLEKSIDPLEYPLDGLILYYLSVINGDIMIHASGVNHKGKGYVFSGVSGRGKTTMAGLWRDAGASVIHDDRLILRKTAGGFRMYNTPLYDGEVPSDSGVDDIFLIEHGNENNSSKLHGAFAVTAVMANCIQHNWGQETISSLLQSVAKLCSEVPVFRLSFKPDNSVIDHLHG